MRIWFALTLGAAALLTEQANSDEPAVAAMYGSGVHAYYAEGYQQSFDSLSRVIRIGTADPRAYYFRGLAALKLGRRDEAVADFTEGAELEAEGWSMRTVSRSLERIQGSDRLLLEQSRAGARLALAKRQADAAASLTRNPSMEFGRRYSGIGGMTTQRTPEPTPAPSRVDEIDPTPMTQPGPTPQVSASPADDKSISAPESESVRSTTPSSPADPFEQDPFTEKPMDSKATETPEKEMPAIAPPEDDPFNFAPRRATSNAQRDQVEEQLEMLDAEASDVLDQQEAMAERDAAAGDR